MAYKLFTDSDLDGVSCGILAKYIFGNEVDIMYCVPNNINERIEKFINTTKESDYDKIFITDLSIKESTAKLINNSKIKDKVKFFDHHQSSLPLRKYDYDWIEAYTIKSNKNCCGTSLFWDYLYTMYIGVSDKIEFGFDVVDQYVDFVRLWDTWDWTNNGDAGIYAKNLNTIFNLFDIPTFTNNILMRLKDADYQFISENEQFFINIEEERKKKYIDNKMKTVRIIDVKGNKVAVVFAEDYISELGNHIAKNIKDINYAAMIIPDIGVVSLRAIKSGNVNLSEIAKSFGGGGHPLSAGFSFAKELNDELINKIFNINIPMKVYITTGINQCNLQVFANEEIANKYYEENFNVCNPPEEREIIL